MKKIVLMLLCIALIISLFTGCSKVFYYFNDAVSFRLENESGQKIYIASISFGTEDTVFGSMAGSNADGTALPDKGKESLIFPVESGDLNDAKLEDMVFDFYVCTQKDSDFVYVGRVLMASSKLHQTYTVTVVEKDGRLILSGNAPELNVIPAAGKEETE